MNTMFDKLFMQNTTNTANSPMQLVERVNSVHRFAVSPRYQIVFPAVEFVISEYFQALNFGESMILNQQFYNFLSIYAAHQITNNLFISGIKSFLAGRFNTITREVTYINAFLDALLGGFIDYSTFLAMISILSGTIEISTIFLIVGILMLLKNLNLLMQLKN